MTAPSNLLSASGTNNANYNPNYGTGPYTDPVNLLTPVGSFADSPGPYDTYDMGGDVDQWNEEYLTTVGLLDGEWVAGRIPGPRTIIWFRPRWELPFRCTGTMTAVSELHWSLEPGSLALLLAGAVGLLAFAWRPRWKTMVRGSMAVVVVSLAVGTTWGQVQYSVTDLGVLTGGTDSWAYGINDGGQDRGQSQTTSSGIAFLYSNGTMDSLGALPGGGVSSAEAINDSGEVGGNAANGSYYEAFLYNGGSMLGLGTLGGNSSWATGINASGEVVGDRGISSGPDHAFLDNYGTMHDLGTLGGLSSEGIRHQQQRAGCWRCR